jgi:hypothetical protein
MIPALRRLRQEDPQFRSHLDYTVRLISKKRRGSWKRPWIQPSTHMCEQVISFS